MSKDIFSTYFLVLVLFGSFLAAACANRVAPSGGEKDILAPEVLNSSPKNGTTNFASQSITFKFNEFVKLQNPNSQILISPMMKERPDIRIRGKNIIVKFKEDLAPNTTYTIDFGESIKDLTENNPMKNFTYAFSTGEVMDSISMKGKVLQANNNRPVADVLVALYPAGIDSLFKTTPPKYIGRTDENGLFKLNNLPPNKYQLVALVDKNNNFYFDQANEEIGFYPQTLDIEYSPSQDYKIKLFSEGDGIAKIKEKRNREYGHIELQFSDTQDSLAVDVFLPAPTAEQAVLAKEDWLVEKSLNNDTLHVWYRNLADQAGINVVLNRGPNMEVQDTVRFKRTIGEKTLQYIKYISNFKGGRGISYLNLKETGWMQFNHPIASFDKSKVVLLEALNELNVAEVISFSPHITRRMLVKYDWKPETDYQLIIPDSTFTDFFGNYNDEIDIYFKTYEEDKYGTLIIKCLGFDAGKQYLLRIYDGKGQIVKKRTLDKSETTIGYMSPAQYQIIVVEDENENGEWDTGNYSTQKQPEPVYTPKEPVDIKSKWDTEVEIGLE